MIDDTAPLAAAAGEGEPAPEPVDAPAAETAADAATGETPAPETEAKPKQVPWFQGRINELTAKFREAERRAEVLEAERSVLSTTLEGLRKGGEAATPAPGTPTSPAEIERLVETRAAQKAEERAFIEACDRTAAAGAKAHPDFDDARRNLVDAFSEVIGKSPDFLKAITTLPNGHEVFYRLGRDLDHAAKVLRMEPIPMAIELARLDGEVTKPTPTSKAPEPIRPIDGAARGGNADPAKMNVKEFMAWREKDVRDKARARYARPA